MPTFLHVHSGAGPHLIPLDSVIEVLPMLALDRGGESARSGYCGLLRFRGQAVPTFALSEDDQRPEEHLDWMLVVGLSAGAARAWVVRDVLGVLQVEPERVQHPELGSAAGCAVVDLDGRLVRVLGEEAE